MRLKSGYSEVNVNTMSNWPLIVDLFVKWGYPESQLEESRVDEKLFIDVVDTEKVTSELSAWGIPWKKTYSE